MKNYFQSITLRYQKQGRESSNFLRIRLWKGGPLRPIHVPTNLGSKNKPTFRVPTAVFCLILKYARGHSCFACKNLPGTLALS